VYTLITLLLILGIIAVGIRNQRLHRHVKQLAHEFDETSVILESLDDGLIECDRDMVIVRMNHPAERILGIEAASVVNRSFSDKATQTPTEKILVQVLNPPKEAVTQGTKSYSYDVFLPAPSAVEGDITKLRIYTIPKTDPSSKTLLGYIKIVRDVTIETVLETHKNDLVSIVSHQLLTPLTGTKWILKSLQDGDAGAVTPKQSEMIKKGLATNEQMIDLVSNILDVSKVEQAKFSYKFEPVDIGALIVQIIADHQEKASTRQIRIEQNTKTPGKMITLDKERIGIALSNIIDNAIDYSPSGSSVAITTQARDTGVTITITDHGIGVPQGDQAKLFVKFYRAENAKRVRTTGTGLGLYIAKHIIEAHGGSITCVSKEGDGATFTINLSDAPRDNDGKSQPAFV